ncbi:MAG: crotonase/enoyl-CoA hydratase family protein [Candidatus Binatia bacterium]|nr:crotonase/enoyl-CoA hydratase family protein [Candidatus Binatia bacterium]
MAIRVEKEGHVTTVILDRPEVRNAVDYATAQELKAAFLAFEADPEAYVGVLWGDHGTFCAGYDLKALAAGTVEGKYDPEGDGPLGVTRLLLSKPVIAAISGYAVAGGLELALWCDLRVMEEDAQVGVFCRRWGVPLVDGGTVRLPRLIGMSRALDLILTGRAVGAQEALAMGLCNRVVPKGQARAEAQKLAHQLARFPQLCLRTDRLSAYRQWDLDLVEALKHEGREGLKPIVSEARAGAARFAAGAGRGGSFDDL